MAAMQATKQIATATREDVPALKLRIQELEKQVLDYKHRLEDLRKAKSNFIVKKEKEYVHTGPKMSKSGSIDSTAAATQGQDLMISNESRLDDSKAAAAVGPCEQCEEERTRRVELEKIIQALSNELDDSKNVIVALKLQNEEAKQDFDRRTKMHQNQLADACYKEEQATHEVKKWEAMYKEWMQVMEERVNQLMQTNAFLQKMLEDQNPDRNPSTSNNNKNASKK